MGTRPTGHGAALFEARMRVTLHCYIAEGNTKLRTALILLFLT